MTRTPSSFSARALLCVIALLGLILLHVIPLPILEVLVLYVLIARPYWFKNLVDQIYAGKPPQESE